MDLRDLQEMRIKRYSSDTIYNFESAMKSRFVQMPLISSNSVSRQVSAHYKVLKSHSRCFELQAKAGSSRDTAAAAAAAEHAQPIHDVGYVMTPLDLLSCSLCCALLLCGCCWSFLVCKRAKCCPTSNRHRQRHHK